MSEKMLYAPKFLVVFPTVLVETVLKKFSTRKEKQTKVE